MFGWRHVIGGVLLSGCAAGGDGSAAEATDGSGPGVAGDLVIEVQNAGTESLFQAVSPVDADTVWISGHDATFAVTVDGGRTWASHVMPDVGDLQFRDVAAFDASTAYLMSAGEGEQSRIYRTDDGGDSWRLQYLADHPSAFIDCMDFWDVDRGLVYGDAVDGVPFILRTDDGGNRWVRVEPASLPAALEGEGGFAASGTCLVTGEGGRAWIATGNGERARVLVTDDFGGSWRAVDVPVVAGAASGLTTVAMRTDGGGIALGGVIGNDSIRSENVAHTRDGGTSWEAGPPLPLPGPVYGSTIVPGLSEAVVAVGPTGLVWSGDFGTSWNVGDRRSYWAVGFASPDAGWAVGPSGRVVKLTFKQR